MNTANDLEQPGFGNGLSIINDIRQPDVGMPALQQLQTQQQVSLAANERPGELDPGALNVMHASTQYEQVQARQYPAVQMDQDDVNSHRSRHFTLLMKGLASEEQQR